MKKLLSIILLFLLPMTFLVSCTAKDTETNKITKENTTTVAENTIDKENVVNENKNTEIPANNETVSTAENNIENKNEPKEDTTTLKVDSVEEEVIEEIEETEYEIITLYPTINQYEQYELPNEVEIELSGQLITIPIDWQGIVIDTSYVGAFTYEGINEEYDIKVDVILTINKVEENNLMGVVKDLYESDGRLFVDIDMVEFYRGDEAVNEAVKDGKAVYDEEKQRYFVYDGYYLRNTDVTIETFELNEDSQYYLCQYDVDPNTVENSATNVTVSRQQFIEYINKYSSYDEEGSINRAKLFRIKAIGNTIVSIEKQYTP